MAYPCCRNRNTTTTILRACLYRRVMWRYFFLIVKLIKIIYMSNLREKTEDYVNSLTIIGDLSHSEEEMKSYSRTDFVAGYSLCQKEHEEKLRWIKVKNDYIKTELQEDILIKFKSSLNREVIVVGHIFQGRFYMNYSNDARPLKNVMSFRCFL